MSAPPLRCVRVGAVAERLVEPGSKTISCGNCGHACWVAPSSVRYAGGMMPVCDVCLPAEPVGRPGTEHR